MKAKKVILFALLVMLLLLTFACGGGEEPGGGRPPSEGQPPVPATYHLYTYVDGGGSISPSGGAFSKGDQVTLSATPSSGWRFDHWSVDASGTSSTVTVSMYSDKTVTAHFVKLNPPIRVILDKVQAIEDSEPFFMAPGDFYFVVVVTDGDTTSELRIPSSGNYPLYDGDTVNINAVCFSTSEVSDYLQVVIVGFEEDSGICYGQYVVGALPLLGSLLDPALVSAATVLLSLIEEQRGAEGFWCDKDDFAGSYEHTWYKSQDWGIGSHEVSGPPYLRFWFTIERR